MRVMKSLVLSAVIAVSVGVGVANTPPAVAATQSPPVPLLWKVSDADNAIYLLGSFHLLKPNDYPLSKDVDAAFTDAESLVFEVSPDEMGSPELGMVMAKAGLRTDGRQLKDDLGLATAKKLDAWLAANQGELQKIGMAPQVMQMFEPWFAALTISVLEMTKQGLDPKLGLDAHFVEAGKTSGKRGSGLETGAQQVALFDSMSLEEQRQFMDEALTSGEEGPKEIEKLHAAWRAGDVDAMWTGMAADMRKEYPRLYKVINVERNDAWVPKLERRLKDPGSDETLVVVGALHLLGSDGVVEKLRAKGYKVQRICSACKTAR
ncbi:MAG: TraB/GumN family protein [Lysobacter sp.]|nr:TraB/GumN family protein [Lysobacter sp.]